MLPLVAVYIAVGRRAAAVRRVEKYRRGRSLPDAGPAMEGGLDAARVLVIADRVPELALGDGGMPAVGPVTVAAFEGSDGVLGVAQGVDELAHLVGLAGKEAVTALGPPTNLRLRLSGAEDQVSLPLDPQGGHLERTRQDVQGTQSERIVCPKAERRLQE